MACPDLGDHAPAHYIPLNTSPYLQGRKNTSSHGLSLQGPATRYAFSSFCSCVAPVLPRQAESENTVSDSAGPVLRLSLTEDQLFIVSFEDGVKYACLNTCGLSCTSGVHAYETNKAFLERELPRGGITCHWCVRHIGDGPHRCHS